MQSESPREALSEKRERRVSKGGSDYFRNLVPSRLTATEAKEVAEDFTDIASLLFLS